MTIGGALLHGAAKRILDFSTGRAIVGVPGKWMVTGIEKVETSHVTKGRGVASRSME
jgi:hypothetical protein